MSDPHARRFSSLNKLHGLVIKTLDEKGSKDPKAIKTRQKLSDEFMELRLSPRMFDHLINQLREHLNEIRTIEKTVMQICVRDAGMPRPDFIETFPRNETNLGWLDKHIRAKRKHSAALARLARMSRSSRTVCAPSSSARISRSARSRRSTAKLPSARHRHGAQRKRWSRRTCVS